MPKSSDLRRAFAEDGPRRTHIGGQALIEGVMMRGKLNWAVAVREPDGNLHFEEHDLGGKGGRPKWFSWPLVRGCVALVDSLALGFKALEIAANHAFDDEEDEAPEGARAAESKAVGTPASAEPVGAGEPAVKAAVSDEARSDSRDANAAESDGEASADAESSADEQLSECEASEQEACESEALGQDSDERPFSWKRDFGRPDTMIEALGAQASLEVVHEPAGDDRRSRADAVSEEPAAPVDASLKGSAAPENEEKEDPFGTVEMAISMTLGIVLGVALFIFLPAFLSNVLVGDYEANPFAWNIVDGVLRVAVFVFYVWLIGRMKDIKRMFSYHGAEHKTIHCYEHGLELTPENARSFPRLHVRCGTAFLIMVMIIAIVVYTVVPMDALLEAWGIHGAAAFVLLIVLRLVLLPLIAGISYEITVKWAGSRPDNPVVRVVLWPGMQMQRLTTNEPDDGMLECAIKAMQLVVAREERAEREAPGAEASGGRDPRTQRAAEEAGSTA